jgi:hypothetical protein
MDTSMGHKFAIVKSDTDEVVHAFKIDEPDEDGEFIFVVGPAKQEQRDEDDDDEDDDDEDDDDEDDDDEDDDDEDDDDDEL